MRVLGIDCGSEITGYGVVEETTAGKLRCLEAACIRLSARESLSSRLERVFVQLARVIELHQPRVVAIEGVFYSVNAKSALKLGHVRGVAVLAAGRYGLEVAEYAPLTIKSAVVGYGRAGKHQVQLMVRSLLGLEQDIESEDACDAVAVAICHANHESTARRLAKAVS